MKKVIFKFALAAMVFTTPLAQSAGLVSEFVPGLTTPQIVTNTLACEDCLHWRLKGMCFWLKCSMFGCKVRESVKVEHFIPDLTITAYTSNSAWLELRKLNFSPSGATEEADDRPHKNTYLDYKHVEILPNPTLFVFNDLLSGAEAFCRSPIDVLSLPFFLSGYDPNWKNPKIERFYPQSLLGYPKINTNLGFGGFGGYWAPEYPRCGWGGHPFDAINAAVAAHRAASIVTSPASPHLYFPPPSGCGGNVKCWPPAPVQANDNEFNRFQMLYPSHETRAKAFGGSATWANGKTNKFETYLWSLWRKYKCCEKRGQKFLWSTDF